MGEQSLVYSKFEDHLIKGLKGSDQDTILLSWDDLPCAVIFVAPGLSLMEVLPTLLSS